MLHSQCRSNMGEHQTYQEVRWFLFIVGDMAYLSIPLLKQWCCWHEGHRTRMMVKRFVVWSWGLLGRQSCLITIEILTKQIWCPCINCVMMRHHAAATVHNVSLYWLYKSLYLRTLTPEQTALLRTQITPIVIPTGGELKELGSI